MNTLYYNTTPAKNSTPTMITVYACLTVYILVSFPPWLDLLWPLLCGRQPLQEAPHLHTQGGGHVQGQEEVRDATSHLLHR